MENLIIGITGTNGSGKGTVVDYLVKNEGFAHFSASDLIMEEVKRRGLPANRDSMILAANDLRAKHGPGYIAEELLKRAIKFGKDAVIESIRTVGEIKSLRKISGRFILVAVDCDQELRYQRISSRGSVKDGVSFQQFAEQEAREMESTDPNKQNLAACIKMADVVITNEGMVEELHQKINDLLKKL